MNRRANRLAPSHTFTYVDDFFGAGTFTDTISTQATVHETIDKVLGPEGLSVKKNVHAQIAEILGILINFSSATMRPKDKAIEKLFFVLFSIDIDKPQTIQYWQCISSLVNLYSQVMHGMRPFVAPITCMTHQGGDARPRRANTNAQFAIEIWRAIFIVAYINPDKISVPIQAYLGMPPDALLCDVISDATPWRLCLALLHPITGGMILLWTTYRLPFERDIRAQFNANESTLNTSYPRYWWRPTNARHTTRSAHTTSGSTITQGPYNWPLIANAIPKRAKTHAWQ